MATQKERTAKWKASDPVAFYRSARKRTRIYISSPGNRARNRESVKQYRSIHREEIRDKVRARRAELRAVVNAAKDLPCMDCRLRFDPICMDFDHRPGQVKKYVVSRMPSRGLALSALLGEMAKCDVVCSNCHRIRTRDRGYSNPLAPPVTDATFTRRNTPAKELTDGAPGN